MLLRSRRSIPVVIAMGLATACSGAPRSTQPPGGSAPPNVSSIVSKPLVDAGAPWALADAGASPTPPSASGTLGTGALPCTSNCVAPPKQVAVGDGHACLLAGSGELWCWGDDDAGQLGDGGREPRAMPVKVATDIESVAAGQGFTCVLEKGGRARCWGALRPLDRSPTQAEIERACKAGEGGVECKLLAAAKALGKRSANKKLLDSLIKDAEAKEDSERTTARALSPPITDAASIAAGGDTVCTLDRAGRATCFMYAAAGSSTSSIFGAERLAKPTVVKGTGDLVEVAPGPLKSCGRTKAGRVLCWDWASEAKEVAGIADAKAVAMSQERACAVVAGGDARCWSTRSDGPATTVAGLAKLVDVRGGGTQTLCARTESGEVFCWGRLGDDWFAGWGGVLDSETPLKIAGADAATALAVGSGHACAITLDGVRCWGATKRGALGSGFAAEVTSPVEVKLDGPALDVAADGFATCAVLAGGRVRCWGHGYGASARFAAEGAASRFVPGIAGAERVFVGEQIACAIGKGTVSCWAHGDPASPAQAIAGITDAVSVAPGIPLSCAASRSGEVSCFYGAGPALPLPGVRDLAELSYGASDWSCGRKSSGQMLCWAMPLQVPAPTFTPPRVFPIAGAPDALSVATSAFRSCAARANGTVVCTGSMSKTHQAQASRGFADIVQLSVRNMGSIGSLLCARTRAGEVKCQGDGGWGELGTGDFAAPPYPGVATVKGIDDATDLAVGSQHACALRKNGTVWCWGSDALGQVTGVANGVRAFARLVPLPGSPVPPP